MLLQIVTCVLLMQGLYTVDALAIDSCLARLTASLTDGTDTCLAVTNYVKCMLLATNLYPTFITDEDIGQFKREIEAGLAEKGINCDIDVKAIVEELLESDRKGIERTTTRSTGYNHAQSVGDCIDTFNRENTGSATCASLTLYLKCIIRVTKEYVLTSNSNNKESQTVHQILNNGFSPGNPQIECDTKYGTLIEEVRREQGGDNGSKRHQGNGKNGADMVAGSFPFVTLLILTCASVFLLQ